ncbi:MAG TPA: aspartate-semialdehyde dehydrogenase [Geobacteraceae bacterium]|nr:aspartate-semialdehyde dehydrogenase [Geobacteraceae bacterium]
MSKLWNIAIVGATGAVGGQLIECLAERAFPVGKMKYLASARSAGDALEFDGKPVLVEELTHDSFEGVEIAFFAAGEECAREFCHSAARAGAVCIDTSGAWRMEEGVPLVVPEVNPHAIARYTGKGIIASPGAVTTQVVMALKPLHDHGGVERVVVSAFEAVSGAGKKAVEELQRQVTDLLQGKSPECTVHPHQVAFNCLPQVAAFGDNGYTMEEMEIVAEAGKILEAEVRVTATAVRVPVFYGHSAAVNVQTAKKISTEKARELLEEAPGVDLVDDPADGVYPMAIDAVGQDLVLVGRVREDASVVNGLNLWVVADNVRKGAATNVVQIAEVLIVEYLK